jgi:predicted metal-dependent hydrolase
MVNPATDYEPRYLGGIVCFNHHDFFEAHEVWEDLWLECAGPERRFYQALIQAAVALYHFGNGNLRGARKLYASSKAYMDQYASPFLGLDATTFWQQMQHCFAAVHAHPNPDRSVPLDETLVPVITLDPPPERWPDPAEFVPDEDEASS